MHESNHRVPRHGAGREETGAVNIYIPLWVIKLIKYALLLVATLVILITLTRVGGIWFALFVLVVLEWAATRLAKIAKRSQ
jgi:hypothetical protein